MAEPVEIAQSGGDRPSPDAIIKRMDKDGDGKLSAKEFPVPQQRFQALDTDGDGFVTADEFARAMERGQSGGGSDGKQAAPRPHADWYAKLPVILTHTHFNVRSGGARAQSDDWGGTLRAALALMDRNGVRTAIVMSPPQPHRRGDTSHFSGLLRIARENPGRFFVSGGGESLNGMIDGTASDRVGDGDRRDFTARAEAIARAGAVGFGETTALHFSFFSGHPFEMTPPDHPLFLLLADLAAKYDIPLDLHVEAVTQSWAVSRDLRDRGGSNPREVGENMTAFERLLGHNPKAKILWVHLGADTTGQRTVALTRRLLEKYPNLHIAIKGPYGAGAEDPLFIPGAGLNVKWRDLIVEFSDRFMIGSDVFFQSRYASREMPANIEAGLRILRQPFLPPAVARKVAFENAQRLFKIDVIKPESYPLPAGGEAARTAAATAAVPAGPPPAHDGPVLSPRGQTAAQVIGNLDGDGDGKVSRKEFPGQPQQFGAFDADGDGFVTKQEFEARWRALAARQQQR